MKRKIRLKEESSKIQFCLESNRVEEVVKMISSEVNIIGASVRFGMPMARIKQIVPKKLRNLGVQSLTRTVSTSEVNICFDSITKEVIVKNVKEISKNLDLDFKKAVFRNITIEKDGNVAKFESTTKEMLPKNSTDLRMKIKVLGLTAGKGKVNTLISSIGAKKFECQFEDVKVKQIAMCRIV